MDVVCSYDSDNLKILVQGMTKYDKSEKQKVVVTDHYIYEKAWSTINIFVGIIECDKYLLPININNLERLDVFVRVWFDKDLQLNV